MPPIASYSYRVLFNFSPYRSGDEYWKSEGKDWSKRTNCFEKPNSDLTKATEAIIAGASTPDAKLRKIYAAVMALENSDYTREHEAREDKANGLGKLNDADDVLKHKRGDSTQLAELFVSMARAAGFPADLMLVPDRSKNLFIAAWLTFSQFDDAIAIVNVDGKDQFFDPGSRYCPYGQLAWEHTFLKGLRQKGDEAIFADTPGSNYLANKTDRVANLNMDSNGGISGTIDLTFMGAPALHWRQDALRGDEESVKHSLRTHLEDMIPKSLEIKDVALSNLDEYEQPLKVTYTVAGTMGTRAGKRLLMPADLFLANDRATFPHEKRKLAVYFLYPQSTQDALRLNFPTGFSIEATPSDSKFNLPKEAVYDMTVTAAPTNFITRRVMAFNDIFVLATDYTPLRNFYSQFEANDQQSIVLKLSPQTTSTAKSAPAN
ncbi:MAG TPA: transglutaminase domain-containing protein [Acidobacteriaceae bacterium]